MKKILNVLLLGMLMCAAFAIIIVANKDSEKPSEVQTRTETRTKAVNTRVLTKDEEALEFEILYEGNEPQGLLKGHIYMTIKHMVFDKYVLELLKHNSLAHLGDSLEYYITPLDSTFKVLLINTTYHLSPEVRELWDEYMATKIEETKTSKKDKNLKILYGE